MQRNVYTLTNRMQTYDPLFLYVDFTKNENGNAKENN